MKIFPFELKYKNEVIELVSNIQQNEFNVPIKPEQQPDLMDIPKFCQIDNGNFWLAQIDNKIVGTIALIDNHQGIGTIRKMFVKADYRGKEYGTAQKLLDTLWVWATDKHFQSIYLGTIERLYAARRFYEKNGFQLIEKSHLPAAFPIMEIDTHFYYKNC